jgi:hypothetical protein
MRHIKEYHRLFENTQELTQEQKDWLDDCVRGTWWVNPKTGLVDVDGKFECKGQELTDLKGVRFGKVKWTFDCSDNFITSLVGAPQTVGSFFFCNDNSLTSLVGAPQKVGASFDCSNNSLTSLEGLPNGFVLGGSFYCSENSLTSLAGLPDGFSADGNFNCSDNSLTSLKGAPQNVNGTFNCSDNQLTSLKGGPQSVRAGFFCANNSLTSLEGAPQRLDGGSFCLGNPISEGVIKGVLKRMSGKNIPLEQAVIAEWRHASEDDRVYLAKHNPYLSPEERKEYAALERLKKRII